MAEYMAERKAYLEAFSENVRRLREERGLSQADLYKLADLHRTQLGRMEGGDAEPRLMTLVIIADALGVKVDDLVAGLPVPKERRPPPNPKPKRAKRAGAQRPASK